MRSGVIWNHDLSCFEALPVEQEHNKVIMIPPLSECVIGINNLGYIYLYHKKQKVKKLSFEEYLRIKNIVKGVVFENE